MTIKKPLDKENFWNDTYAKYPNATQEFCEWIDKYKQTVFWAGLFKEGIKFHHIPYAMQLGIFLTYMSMFEDSGDTIYLLTEEPDFIHDLKSIIRCFFEIRETEIKDKNEQ